jgi:superoxide dismutase
VPEYTLPDLPYDYSALEPHISGRPEGEIAAAIDDQFGSFDGFSAHFTATALGVQARELGRRPATPDDGPDGDPRADRAGLS